MMLALWNSISLVVLDPLLGWALHLHRDLALVIVAALTAAGVTFVRLWTANQDLLRRAAADKKRIKVLIREARARGDRDAVGRHRATRGMVLVATLKGEAWTMAAVVLPIAMLATWAMARLDRLPPAAGEPIEIAIHTPSSAIGEAAHIVPENGIEAIDGWVREIVARRDGERATGGVARWTIRAVASDTPHEIAVRHHDLTLRHEVLVGQATYLEPTIIHDGAVAAGAYATTAELRRAEFLGVVPGWGDWLPPWLVAYLLLVVPLHLALRRVTGIR